MSAITAAELGFVRGLALEAGAIVSISHRDEALERVLAALRPAQTLSAGSVGYKAGKIAAGEADLYVAPSPAIRLWDTCAPEAILRAAGGSFLGMDGRPLDYAGPDLRHARGVLASNGACLAAVLDRLK